MGIAAVTGSSLLTNQTQKTQQTQSVGQSSSSKVGEAAVLELSGAQGSTSMASDSVGKGGGSSNDNSCSLGKGVCMSCGQCGKTTTSSSSAKNNTILGQQSTSQAGTTANALTATAINAYEMNSILL